MTLAFFGGSFNPPHNGHLAIGVLVRELFHPDKIILSASRNPFKLSSDLNDATQSSKADEHRLALLKLFAQDLNRTGDCFEVSDWELRKNQPSYTIETLEYFRGLYSPNRILLCIGEDQYREFDRWKNYKEILKQVELIVFTRKNTEPFSNESIFNQTIVSKIALDLPISSSKIRSEHDCKFEVPSEIARYISMYGLYR